MPPKIKFEFDRPQTIAFTQNRGKAVESRFPGEAEFFRNVDGLKCAYLPASLERMLLQMNYLAGESVVITKRKTDAGATYWDVDFAVHRSQPNPTPEPHEPTRPAPRARTVTFPDRKYCTSEPPPPVFPEVEPVPASSSNASAATPATADSLLARCLCEAVDAVQAAQKYATARGYAVAFGAPEVERLGVSIFIERTRNGAVHERIAPAPQYINGRDSSHHA